MEFKICIAYYSFIEGYFVKFENKMEVTHLKKYTLSFKKYFRNLRAITTRSEDFW